MRDTHKRRIKGARARALLILLCDDGRRRRRKREREREREREQQLNGKKSAILFARARAGQQRPLSLSLETRRFSLCSQRVSGKEARARTFVFSAVFFSFSFLFSLSLSLSLEVSRSLSQETLLEVSLSLLLSRTDFFEELSLCSFVFSALFSPRPSSLARTHHKTKKKKSIEHTLNKQIKQKPSLFFFGKNLCGVPTRVYLYPWNPYSQNNEKNTKKQPRELMFNT
jgi:hypothetical protein